MRKLKNYWSVLLLCAVTMFTVSCSDTDEIAVDPDADFDVVLNVSETDVTPQNEEISVNPATTSSILAKVSFTSTDESMRRLYITQNLSGTGENIYEPQGVTLKGDGSIDISTSNAKAFEFQFTLPVPDTLGANGNIVYKFWATSGNGDPRDPEKRNVAGPGTITINFGTGSNPAAEVKSYSNIQLTAPSSDGLSNTFVSLLDGETYNVSQGIEFVSFWDFGYLYSTSTSDAATLRAPFNYNVPYFPGALANPVIDIPAKAGTTNEELNKTYFKASTTSSSEFDGITVSADLNFVSVTQNDETIRITQLAENDIIEFVDSYGKKGLIKVLEIEPGNTPQDFIRIAIKVQP